MKQGEQFERIAGGPVCVKEGGIRGKRWRAMECEGGRRVNDWRESVCEREREKREWLVDNENKNSERDFLYTVGLLA